MQRQLAKVQALCCTVLEGQRNVKGGFGNPGGLDITTRVTRRSETSAAPDRLDTSEYFQQVQAHAGTCTAGPKLDSIGIQVHCMNSTNKEHNIQAHNLLTVKILA